MSVEVYNFVLCKNPLGFFGKIEQTILIFILVHIGNLYYNLILSCPIGLENFHAISTCYQTLKSRIWDPLEKFLHMKL